MINKKHKIISYLDEMDEDSLDWLLSLLKRRPREQRKLNPSDDLKMKEIWDDACEIMEKELTEVSYNTWIKNITQIAIVLLGISFMSFLLIYLAPGDPVRAMFAVAGSIPLEEAMGEMREELGLNKPFLVQYGDWLSKCLKGDFGTSYSQGRPVSRMLSERVAPTLNLALLSLVIMLIIAPKMGQGRVCTMEMKAFEFTYRTKVFAGDMVWKISM